jgi:hypothetical protein
MTTEKLELLRRMAISEHTGENVGLFDDAPVNGEEIEHNGKSYLVLTDEEANDKCAEYIRESLWAFNTDFILSHCKLPLELEKAIRSFQEMECEGANDAMLALVEKCGDFDKFVEDAISADGRGHFLAGYDGNENEITVTMAKTDTDKTSDNTETFYIYRTN